MRLSHLFILVAPFSLAIGIALGILWRFDVTKTGVPNRQAVTLPALRAEPIEITAPVAETQYVSPSIVEEVMARLRPTREMCQGSVPHLVHAYRLWGSDAEFRDKNILNGERMLWSFTTNEGFGSLCPDAPPLLMRSRYGISVRVSNTPDAAPHTDKCLAVLAETGIHLDTAVEVSGYAGTVRDLLIDSVMRFQSDQPEIQWTTVAYSHYLPGNGTWTNKFGERSSFDELADRLVRAELWDGPCYGTHSLYALICILRADEQENVLSSQLRERVVVHVRAVSDLLRRTQYRTGAWALNWADEPPESRGMEVELDQAPKNLARATGHHLEWIALAPPHLRPPVDSCQRAAAYVSRLILARQQSELVDGYGPYSHAARALVLLSGSAKSFERSLGTGGSAQ